MTDPTSPTPQENHTVNNPSDPSGAPALPTSAAPAQPATDNPPSAKPGAAANTAHEHVYPPPNQVVTIIIGLMMGMFLGALDQTIVSTSIRTIADDLNGLSLQAWATTAYLITSTIATPLYGKLSDIYGRRPFFLAAISIFILGSALCTMSTSMYMLAAFRAIQGIGAGGLFSLALAIVGDIVPPRERAKYQGYFLAVFGTSSVLGPLIGGFFANADSILGVAGWRWVFLVNVPIGLLALVVVWRNLHVEHQRVDHKVDWLGAFTLMITLVPLLILAEQGREWGWTSTNSMIAAGIGLVGLVLFIFAERAAGYEALLPTRLFSNRAIGIPLLLGALIGFGMFGAMMVLPLWLQIVHGANPMQAGLWMLPLMVGIMSASIMSGQLISRTGRYKIFPIVGTALMAIGAFVLSRLTVDSSMWFVSLGMLIFGLGLGNNMQPLTLAVQNAADRRDMGIATSAATFFRQMGGTLGVAVFLSILFSTVTDRIATAFQAAIQTPDFQAALRDPAVLSNPADQQILTALQSGGGGGSNAVLNDSSFISQLDPRLAHPFLVGFSEAMSTVLLTASAILAVTFLLTFFIPERKIAERHPGPTPPAAESLA
ncbi:MAG: MDR family MFS transporter [Actinomycetales bacterium]